MSDVRVLWAHWVDRLTSGLSSSREQRMSRRAASVEKIR